MVKSLKENVCAMVMFNVRMMNFVMKKTKNVTKILTQYMIILFKREVDSHSHI